MTSNPENLSLLICNHHVGIIDKNEGLRLSSYESETSDWVFQINNIVFNSKNQNLTICEQCKGFTVRTYIGRGYLRFNLDAVKGRNRVIARLGRNLVYPYKMIGSTPVF